MAAHGRPGSGSLTWDINMNNHYYSLKTVKKEQARMQKRACRSHLYGRKISVPTRSGQAGAYLYHERNDHPGYLILEVHGGGFMYNTAADDDDFCRHIHEATGIPVAACDYRLSPEARFPTGLQDVYDCVKYMLTIPELEVQPDKIIFWGHSAGANLAAGATYMAVTGKEHIFTPCMLILDYPYMDPYRKSDQRRPIRASVSGKLMDTFAHYYVNEAGELKNILISPILYRSERFRNMPETYLNLCGRDNLKDAGMRYGKLLKEAGVPVTIRYEKEALHGFIENHYNYANTTFLTKLQTGSRQRKLAEASVDRILTWLRERIEEE